MLQNKRPTKATRPSRPSPTDSLASEPAPPITDDYQDNSDDEETEDPYGPVTVITSTERGEIVYPTDTEKTYPSSKDGVYGIVIQLTTSNKPRFARARGKEVIIPHLTIMTNMLN